MLGLGHTTKKKVPFTKLSIFYVYIFMVVLNLKRTAMKKLSLFKKLIYSIFFPLLVFANFHLNAQTYEYSEKSPMRTPLVAPSACALDGKIYVYGGSVTGLDNGSADLYIYDIANNTWSTGGKNMLTHQWMHGSAVVNGKLYSIGGGFTSEVFDINQVYDPATNTWETKSPMPTARGALTVCAVNDKVYAIGGFANRPNYSVNEMYDPVTDTWTQKAPMPTDRNGLTSVAVNGKIYVIGGTVMPYSALTTVEVYDPVTDTWTKKSSMNHGRFGLVAASYRDGGKDYIVAMGGTRSNMHPSSGYIEVYDIQNNTWTELENMPLPSQWGAGCSFDNRVYFMGGEDKCCFTFDDATILNNVFEYDFRLFAIDENTGNKTNLQVFPNPVQTTMNIDFQLTKSDHVKLVVYNNIGQLVEIVLESNLGEGRHTITFNSSHLKNGLYYILIQANKVTNVYPFQVIKY